MIVRTYSLTSPAFIGEVLFSYNAEGYLWKYEVKAELATSQIRLMLERIPLTEEQLQPLIAGKQARITEVKPNVTFDHFWEQYDYKEGTKKRAEKLWNSLTSKEKLLALYYIPKYNLKLATSKVAKQYPETYLSTKRFAQ
ncbi:hypothetical protein BH09BAC1_BH09BAC1_14280 [soil metagenome]